MRTKTLLLSAAAIVAGILSSQAQSNVYSANVVGYASVVLPGNGQFVLVANPFDDGNGNQVTNLIDKANSLPKQSQVLTWNGSSFNVIAKVGATPTWGSSVSIPPGQGFFVRNGSPGSLAPNVTNTFVGSIVVPNGGSVTNQVPVGFSLQGTPIPYAGNLAISGSGDGDTNMDFGGVLGKQAQILTWSVAGQTYNIAAKVGGTPTWGANVTIAPTDGFFINNKNGPATNVVENLNLQ